MVSWYNKIIEVQQKFEEEQSYKDEVLASLGEKMNDKLATRIFGKFDPIYDKIAWCWTI